MSTKILHIAVLKLIGNNLTSPMCQSIANPLEKETMLFTALPMQSIWTWPSDLLNYGQKTKTTCVDLSWQFCVDSMAAMIGSRLLTGRVIMMGGIFSPEARSRGHVRQGYMPFIYHMINSWGFTWFTERGHRWFRFCICVNPSHQ